MQGIDREWPKHLQRSSSKPSSPSFRISSSTPSSPRARPAVNPVPLTPSLSATLAAFSESGRTERSPTTMSTLRKVPSSERVRPTSVAISPEDGAPVFRPQLRKVVIEPRKPPSPPPPSAPVLRRVVIPPKAPPAPTELALPDLRAVSADERQAQEQAQSAFPGLAQLRPVSMSLSANRASISSGSQPIAALVKLKPLSSSIQVQEASEAEKQRIREAAERGGAEFDNDRDMFRSKNGERASWTPQQFAAAELVRRRDEEIARLEQERLQRAEEDKARKLEEERKHKAVEEERKRKIAEEEQRLRAIKEAEEAAERERLRIKAEEEARERERIRFEQEALERERLRLEEKERERLRLEEEERERLRLEEERERLRLEEEEREREEEERERERLTTAEASGSDDELNSELAQSHHQGDEDSLSSYDDDDEHAQALALLSEQEQEEERLRRIELRKIRKNARTKRTDDALNATFGPNAEEVYSDAKNKLRVSEYEKIEVEKDTDFEGTPQLFRKLTADKGDVTAQYFIARCYIEGRGVAKNMEKAKRYLHLAAAQGHVHAKEKLQSL